MSASSEFCNGSARQVAIGERFEPETGLVYLHARYCDPKLGLFTQGDWWDSTEPGVGANRDRYSFGDPVNLSDPKLMQPYHRCEALPSPEGDQCRRVRPSPGNRKEVAQRSL